jgi:hypothetical protein
VEGARWFATTHNKKVAALARGARFSEHGAGAPRRQLLTVTRQLRDGVGSGRCMEIVSRPRE